MTDSTPPPDPVLARRARIATWSSVGKKVGYTLYALALVLFFVGLGVGFDHGIATMITAGLVVGAAFLIPAIVFAYGVKAADRDDAEQAVRRDAG